MMLPLCYGHVRIGDEKSAIRRRGDGGTDRRVDKAIDADDAILEPARHGRTNRISVRVEEMRQQIDVAAGLRIFVNDDEVAIGKGDNRGIGLRSRKSVVDAACAEVNLFLAEPPKSGSHCHPPINNSLPWASSRPAGGGVPPHSRPNENNKLRLNYKVAARMIDPLSSLGNRYKYP